jgi:hypothetical protein
MVHARIATLPKGVRADTAIAVSVPTQTQAAKLLNVSVDSGQRARRVIDDGVPELVEAVERGLASAYISPHRVRDCVAPCRATDLVGAIAEDADRVLAGS